jgi:hypothetical protein
VEQKTYQKERVEALTIRKFSIPITTSADPETVHSFPYIYPWSTWFWKFAHENLKNHTFLRTIQALATRGLQSEIEWGSQKDPMQLSHHPGLESLTAQIQALSLGSRSPAEEALAHGCHAE